MSSKAWLSAFGYTVLLMALASIASCGSSSPVSGAKDGGTGTAGGTASGAGGAGGDQSGAGGAMSAGTAGSTMTGAGGDMTGAAGATGAGGAAGGAGGATGTAGKGGGAGAGGATGTAGKGGGAGTGGNRDGGAGDAGALAMCRNATTCKAGDPPCLRSCGNGRDVTCECGTGTLAGMLVCDNVCVRPDGGTTMDAGAVPACPANIRSSTTACTPRTEMTCETACANNMHRECVCAATGGGRGVWFCFAATACM
jgi:hypothetical protein